jgi:hypothetical protein
MTPVAHRARGVTRLEFAVCAIVFGVLTGMLLHYMSRYRAEAELAGVRYQVASMRTALAGKAMEAELAGNPAAMQALVGSNPVKLLKSVPPGYRGEIYGANDKEMPSGSWFFDRKQRSIVYVFTGNKTFSDVRHTRWSFRVESLCLPTNNAKPPGAPGKLSVALHQVDG